MHHLCNLDLKRSGNGATDEISLGARWEKMTGYKQSLAAILDSSDTLKRAVLD